VSDVGRLVAERLAEIKDLPLETVAEVTTQNARAIYELDDAG